MSDQAAFLDEIVRFGDPWHGLYRGGVLELPNATTRTLAVAPENGDCFELVVPGTPAVTTDAADTAAGMTWLDYGLLAGKNHTLYQTNLGGSAWIYVAADGSRWKAAMGWSGVNTVTLSLAPLFGTTPTQNISLSVSPAISYQASAAGAGRLMDIDQTGATAVFAHLPDTEPATYTDWNMLAATRLDLSGTPPSASASLTLIHEIDNPTLGGVAVSDGYIYTHELRAFWTDTVPDPDENGFVDMILYSESQYFISLVIPDPPQGNWSNFKYFGVETNGIYERTDTIGYFFSASGSLLTVKLKEEFENHDGWTGPLDNVLGVDRIFYGTYSRAQSILVGASESAVVTQVYELPGTISPTANQTAGNDPAWHWRYSNRLFGLTEGTATTTRYHPPMTPLGPASVSLIADYPKPFCTYHPITGSTVFHAAASGVVCWV